jgi:hypothetical protein
LQLYHCDHSAPRLNDSLVLLYGYLPRLVADYTSCRLRLPPGLYSPKCLELQNSRKFAVSSLASLRYLPPSGVGLCTRVRRETV